MANVTKLSANLRDRAGKGAARAVRNSGLVPGVIYGEKKEPVLISMDPRVLMGQMHRVGFWTHVFSLDVSGQSYQVLARDVQFHPVNDQPLHVDFLRVGAGTTIRVMVPVTFINELTSPGLKKGGVLNIVRHEVEMLCNVASIPECLVVDLGKSDVGSSIHFSAVSGVGDAKPVITDRDFTIATIAAPSGMKADAEPGAEAAAAPVA
ncbi:MAG: 50S ribosomal protein L25/general stress protein Ctc [Alphaproteobacteria bacterium RIFOXYD12_FULL_60_8]|nr:MAG: 50S ribosomal protein L25/general stress protein Ctc [Alphaproteobacteria bacterium RIFOXYD12_FULL_60_8]